MKVRGFGYNVVHCNMAAYISTALALKGLLTLYVVWRSDALAVTGCQ